MDTMEKIIATVTIIFMLIAIALAPNHIKKGFENIHVSIPEIETTTTETVLTELAIEMMAEQLKD